MFVSRENVKLAGIATACLVVGLSAPAVSHGVHAKFAHQADKVDGKHAVGAGATVAERKGKLVATDANGLLPNDIIAKAPDADAVDGVDSLELQFPTTVPPGRTLVGAWGIDADGDGTGDWGTRISYPVPMPSSLVYRFVGPGGIAPSECPGTPAAPAALPGNVCIFTNATGGASADPFTGYQGNRFGVSLYATDDGNPGDLWAAGTWAATAADAPAAAGPGQLNPKRKQ